MNFHGERRSNATHRSTTDPDSRLYKKTRGCEARLCYLGHWLMENRNGLLVKTRLTRAEGRVEREAALAMAKLMKGRKRRTMAADKNYDTRDFVSRLRQMRITPHVAQNTTNRSSAIDARTMRHAGYSISQRKRKRVEEIFGWMKTLALMRRVKHRGRKGVGWMFTWAAAAYNLVRIRNLIGATA